MRNEAIIVIALAASVSAVAANWWSRVATGALASAMESVSKPTATVAIWLLALAGSDADVSTGALVASSAGFALCLAGDVALLPAIDRFIIGLGSFLAGHLAFVVMFVLLGLDRPWLGLAALAGVVLLAARAAPPIVAGARAKDPKLVAPVRGYLSIISAMAVFGWSTGRPAAIVGSSLFVLSDTILGRRMFVESRGWMPLAVMVTYHGALLGLALTLAG